MKRFNLTATGACLVTMLLISTTSHALITVTGQIEARDLVTQETTLVQGSEADLTFTIDEAIEATNGQIVIDTGSTLTAATLDGIINGTFVVDGAGSQIILNGDYNRLGAAGPNISYQITNGGLIDATTGICGVSTCNAFLGNFAGSNVTLTVDGIGSQLNTVNGLFIANNNTDFGILGEDSFALVNVSNGGVINSDSTAIASGVFGGNIQAGQASQATVFIDGLGTQWNANDFDVATGLNTTATIIVSNGADINAVNSVMSTDPTALTAISFSDANTGFIVADSLTLGAGGTTNLDILNGAEVFVGNGTTLATSGGNVLVTLDGDGSQLTTGSLNFAMGDNATGQILQSNLSTLTVDAGQGNADVAIGAGLNAFGSLSIDGTGSTALVTGTSSRIELGTDAFGTAGDGFGRILLANGASMTVEGVNAAESEIIVGFGRRGVLDVLSGSDLVLDGQIYVGEGGSGTVTINTGGTVTLRDTDQAIGNREVGVVVGLSRDFDDANGDGQLTITGAGSELIIEAVDAAIEAFVDVGISNSDTIGNGLASGTLDVLDGGLLDLDGGSNFGVLAVGIGGNSTGVANISGPSTQAIVTGSSGIVGIATDFDDNVIGAASGALNVTNGATLNIFGTDPGSSFLGFGIGLGNGTGVISGGSSVFVDGDLVISGLNPFITTGNNTTSGDLQILDTSFVSAFQTTIGNNGVLSGDGSLFTDTLNLEAGAIVNFTGDIQAIDTFIDAATFSVSNSFSLNGEDDPVTLIISTGGQFETLGDLNIGDQPGSFGFASFADAGTTALIGGATGSSLRVGVAGGIGSLSIDTGTSAIVDSSDQGVFFGDATVDIGFGGIGDVSIQNGSQLSVIDSVGQGGDDGITVGASDTNGAGDGTLDINGAGSNLSIQGSESGFLNIGLSNLSFTGTDLADGAVDVSNGATVDVVGTNVGGLVSVGRGGNATGILSVTDAGSTVNIGGTSSTLAITTDIGSNQVGQGTGTVNIGLGGTINLTSNNPGTSLVAVGGGGTGTLDVSDGGTLNVDGLIDVSDGGIVGSTGLLNISGTGSVDALTTLIGSGGTLTGNGSLTTQELILQNGANFNFSGDLLAVDTGLDGGILSTIDSLNIGQAGGTSSLGIINGGLLEALGVLDIGTGIGDNDVVTVDGAGSSILAGGVSGSSLQVGAAGGSGSLTLDNAAATTLDSTNQGSFFGDPSLLIGFGGDGDVSVLGGSQLTVIDSSNQDADDVIVVGLNDINGGGNGSLTVDGAGSNVLVQGNIGTIDIGVGSALLSDTATGVLNVTNGATVDIIGSTGAGTLGTGRGDNATGTINVTGAGSTITVTGLSANVEISSDVGGGQGTGLLSISQGGLVDVFGTSPASGSVFIGAGGNGTIQVDDGGTFSVDGTIDVFDGGFANSTGALIINGSGRVGALGTTIGNGGSLSGTGTLISSLTLNTGGLVDMSGIIDDNVFNQGGIVAPGGDGVGGVVSITGDYIQSSGSLQFSLAGPAAGQFDQLDAGGDIDLQGGSVELNFLNGFNAGGAAGIPLLQAGGTLNIDQAVAFNVGAGQTAFELVPESVFAPDGSPLGQRATLNFLEQGLSENPLLTTTENNSSLAIAVDSTCDRLAGLAAPNTDEQDLLNICADVRNTGNTPEQLIQALAAIDTSETTQTINSILLFTIPQHGNLSQRINGIRSGSNPFDFSGLNIVVDEHMIAGADLERFLLGIIGGAAGTDDFDKWGVFGNGNINFGDKDATDNGAGFDFETITMTVGVDYRARDNLVFGGSLSYSDVNADFDEGGGMNLKSWAGSLFATYFTKQQYYVDLLYTYGQNDIDVSRHIIYNTVMGGLNRRADSETDGVQQSFSVAGGYDFTPAAWVVGPHFGANYTSMDADRYSEEGAGGLNLSIDRQTATSFTANLGVHVSRTFTPAWGVITPYARLDWVHEFQDDSEVIDVTFLNDRFRNDPTNPTTPIRVETDRRDSNYMVYSVGASAQFIRGFAGFVNYRATERLSDLSLSDVTWGLRAEYSW